MDVPLLRRLDSGGNSVWNPIRRIWICGIDGVADVIAPNDESCGASDASAATTC